MRADATPMVVGTTDVLGHIRLDFILAGAVFHVWEFILVQTYHA